MERIPELGSLLMVKITREEVLKLAKISRINLHESEIEGVIDQLKSVLSYAERVGEISGDVEIPSSKNVNVFREDVSVRTDPRPILDQAPEGEDDYFVVLPILDK